MKTPLAAVGTGLLAGAAGTVAMTAYQEAVARTRESEGSNVPAQVAERLISALLRKQVPERYEGLLNNAMHWGYGTSRGAAYALLRESSSRRSPPTSGLLFGLGVWGASLVHLPAMKLAPPVWEQPPDEVALDASYHLVYGLAVALGYATIDRFARSA
ncbi:MAG TPA: DUF1440 domain-containing protein [Solirubrobacteraceae bacterium]|nr:DUF1440 domain-containing protein [Solirubrobacteraceae bacterium]